MNTRMLALTTALTLFAFTPAMAQEDLTGVDPACIMKNADGTQTVDKTKCPDGKTMGAASSTTEQPAASTATEQPAPSTTTTGDQQNATAQQPAASSETTSSTTPATDNALIVPADQLNAAKMMSANDYIGKRVYDKAGNDIGEVNDLIISEDGQIRAAILGVGGFLGLGEKDVAVSVRAVEMVQDGNSWKLVVNSTKEQLEAAPSYDRTSRRYTG